MGSKHLQKIRDEDARHQVNSYGHRDHMTGDTTEDGDSSKSASDELRNSMYKGDSLSEYGFSPDEPLGAPTNEALEFLVDCAGMMAGIAGSPIPGQFYQELLRAAVSADSNTEMVTRLLDLGKNKINISRVDMMTISKL